VIPKSATLEIHPSTTNSVQLKITARATESNLDDEIGGRSGQEARQRRVGLCWDTRSRPSRTVANLGSASREIRTGSWRSASHKGSPAHKSKRAFVPLSTGNSPSRVPIAGLVLPTESPKAHGRDTRV